MTPKTITLLFILLHVHFSTPCMNIFEIEQKELNEEQKKLVKAAFRNNDVKQLSAIIDKRWNKNPYMNSKTEETLLHYLAWKGDNLKSFRTVAEKVEDWYIKDKNDEMPVDIAAKKGHKKILDYIIHQRFTEIVEAFGKGKEEFMGKSHWSKALILAGENDQWETFETLVSFFSAINLATKTDKAVLDFVMENKPKYSPRIQKATDTIPEQFAESADESQANSFGDSPPELLAQPVDKFLAKIMDTTREFATANDLKKIDFVPLTEDFLKGAFDAVSKIMELGRSSEISSQFSPKNFKALLIHIKKIISKNQKKFNIMFRQILSKSIVNVEDAKKWSQKLEDMYINEGLKATSTGIQILDATLTIWKIQYPESQIDGLINVFLTGDDISASFIVSVIEDFVKSSSNNFITFLEDNHGINILKKRAKTEL